MYFMTEPNDLVGKEVGFIMANQFSQYIKIVTKDGGIMVISQDMDEYGEDKQTRVLSEYRATEVVYNDGYTKEQIDKLGHVTKKDWKGYEEHKMYLAEKERKEREEFREKAERKKLKELLEKYGNPNE